MELFTLLARSLARLSYGDQDMQAVCAAFLLHFAALSGYRPRLSHCVHCGKEMADSDIRLLDTQSGGLICLSCASQQTALQTGTARRVTPAQVRWMRDVLSRGIDKTDCPPQDAPAALLSLFVEERLEKPLRHKGLWR